MPPKPKFDDPVLGPLTDDRLTAEFWVYQRVKGHRFSSDDVATAYVAWQSAGTAARVLDLGAGIGSVLLTLAWKLPQARLVGIEAQAMSYDLLVRNIARNELGARVTAEHGDLRDATAMSRLGSNFDLITGTPPYFPQQTALDAEDEQRAFARIEYRGGIEAYLGAGAPLLTPKGVMVLCGDARAEPRVVESAAELGLYLRTRHEVIAREGRPPLFSVWTLRFEPAAFEQSTLVLRDSAGARTRDADRLRSFSGF